MYELSYSKFYFQPLKLNYFRSPATPRSSETNSPTEQPKMPFHQPNHSSIISSHKAIRITLIRNICTCTWH